MAELLSLSGEGAFYGRAAGIRDRHMRGRGSAERGEVLKALDAAAFAVSPSGRS